MLAIDGHNLPEVSVKTDLTTMKVIPAVIGKQAILVSINTKSAISDPIRPSANQSAKITVTVFQIHGAIVTTYNVS